jgi:hypothetical protein
LGGAGGTGHFVKCNFVGSVWITACFGELQYVLHNYTMYFFEVRVFLWGSGGGVGASAVSDFGRGYKM